MAKKAEMKKALVILSILFAIQTYAQNSERDSLLAVYRTGAPRDTSFVKLLCKLSQIYRLAVPDSAIVFSHEAYELAQKISYEKGIATSLNIIGTSYFYKGNYPEAQVYQQKAIEYSEAHHLKIPYVNALNSLALAYQYQGNSSSALDYYFKALQFEEEAKNYAGQVKVLTNIGLLYKNQVDFDNSILYSKRALALTDSLKDPRTARASLSNSMGVILTEQKKFAEGLVYLQKSLALNKELGNKIFVASGLGNIGYSYLNMDSLTKAEKFLKQGLAMAREINYTDMLGKSLLNLAHLYLKQKKPLQALPLAKESLALSKKFNHKENIYLNYRAFADCYQQLGQLNLAYDYLEKAFLLGDSLKNTDNTKKLSDLQRSFELKKKESEISLLEKDAALKKATLKEEQNIRYGLIVMVAGLCVLAGIIYYSLSTKAALNKKLEKQNLEVSSQKELIERINKDLKAQALRAQMNPHFIFNSLNSIQFLILQKESAKAFDYLSQFGLLLRKVMDNSEKNFISLSEEIEIMNLYLQLESLRFESSFDYKIESTVENINLAKVPPLVLQPYIENAIQHGLMPKGEDRKLTVTFSQQPDSICCEIKDNGIGRAKALEISKRKNKLFSSRGMNYTSERIEVMNKLLDGRSQVTVTDLTVDGQAAGTLVKILFAYA